MDKSLGATSQSLRGEVGNGLRILYFSSAAHIQGGAVQSMFRNARWLKQHGGEPIVVLPRYGSIIDWYEQEDIEVFVIPFVEMHRRRSPLYLLRYFFSTIYIIFRLAALIKRRRIDIVHVNEIIYWPGLVTGKTAGAKTICHVRTIVTKPDWIRRALIGLAYQFSDQILCVSDAVREKMFRSGDGKIQRLYNPGPDMDRFDPQVVENGHIVRQELKIDRDAFVVGLVSKFIRNKGHLALIETAHTIKVRQPDLNIAYVLVGGRVKGHEGYFAEVRDRINKYGLEEDFILTGMRDDVPRLISACDVMVHLPLHEDPFPGVVLEALAMEKPFVGFASGGVPEQFEDGKSGILLEKGDTEALAQTLLDLSRDEDLRLRMGKEARRFLTSNFTFERFFSELDKIYTSLLTSGK